MKLTNGRRGEGMTLQAVRKLTTPTTPAVLDTAPKYRCVYCGAPSHNHPADQTPPADYCHDYEHGTYEPEEAA